MLNGNALGDDGARYIMSALRVNHSLQSLGLQVRLGLRFGKGMVCIPRGSWCAYGLGFGKGRLRSTRLQTCVIMSALRVNHLLQLQGLGNPGV